MNSVEFFHHNIKYKLIPLKLLGYILAQELNTCWVFAQQPVKATILLFIA